MKLSELFPDGGLRLGLIEVWLGAGTLPDVTEIFDEAVRRAQADDELHVEEQGERTLNLEEPSVVDAVLKHAVDSLGDLEVAQGMLDAVEQLQFDGGNDVYCELLLEELSSRLECEWYELDTGGETAVFEVGSLRGVEHLNNLRRLDLDGHGYHSEGQDLSPLRDHPRIEALSLTSVRNVDVLESLPALKRVRRMNTDMSAGLIESLKARGVKLE